MSKIADAVFAKDLKEIRAREDSILLERVYDSGYNEARRNIQEERERCYVNV